MNGKLLKDNEKLSSKVKSLDAKVYQFYKTNKGLNEQIINGQLEDINRRLSLKFNHVSDL